jgi:hypothetical protein
MCKHHRHTQEYWPDIGWVRLGFVRRKHYFLTEVCS